MARYIDADFVANGLHEVLHRPKSDFPDDYEKAIDCLVYAISILKFAPTADVKPVVHAHWIIEPWGTNWRYSCSNPKCNHYECHAYEDYRGSNYCPCCGAKMDEEAE